MFKLRNLSLSLLFLFFTLTGCSSNERILVLYHTNDIHGYIASREAGKLDEKNPKRLIGGFAALKNLVKKEKHPYLIFDSGDWFSGAPEGSLTEGAAVIELMNHLGFAAAAVGNHEFDKKEKTLRKLAKQAQFPVLSANTFLRYPPKKTEENPNPPSRPDYAVPTAVREVKELGLKVCTIGLITPNTPSVTMPSHVARLKFLRPVNTAKPLVEEFQKQGCGVILALTHIGLAGEKDNFEDEKYLAAHVKGLDAVLGGHSHTYLRQAYHDPENKTIVVQSGRYLTSVTRVELVLDDAGKVKERRARLIDLWVDELGEDKETLEIVKRHQGVVDKKLSQTIGECTHELAPNREGESHLGNLVVDVFQEASGADVAFHNSGGIRDTIPKGPVTLRILFSVLPFDNTLVVMDLTGANIQDILENAVGGDAGSRINVSGLKFRWNPKQPKKHRVTRVEVNGKPVGVTKLYRVVTNSFLAQGGDRYSTFERGLNRQDLGILMRDAAADYIKKHSPIQPPALGRITVEE